MKKIFLCLSLIFISFSLFAKSGIMWGEDDIKYVTTEHFDIIYEPDCADSAALLRENAERILEEIEDFFGAGEIRMRVPVVLSSNCQMFNAACGNVPYPLIYLYDTAIDDGMDVFSNDLLSTFKHELTHAYTLNMKNKFWNGVSKVLGNAYNPANIFVTSGMAESATLTSESSLGEGRLNDEWSLQIARQAKIEDKWPGYYDEQGLSSKYYTGDFYYFNGGFANYLQETYGMEKYAKFWYKCVNFQAVAPSKAFKKIYGIKIWDAWQDFGKSLAVPDYAEPFEVDGVKDFFTNSNEKYSLENDRGAIYRNTSATEKGLYYLDYKCSNVYFVSKEKLSNTNREKISPKKIFHKSRIIKISPSYDGRFIAYEYYDINSANYKYCTAIYDTKTKQHITVGDRLKSTAIVRQNEDYYLLSLNFISQKKQIAIQKINMKNNKVKGLAEPEYILLAEGTNVTSFTDIGDGYYAMIVKSGLKWELCFGEIGSEYLEKVELPEERMTMRYLSYSPNDNSIYFSWTKPDAMPRLGKFSLDAEEFILSDKNISGGVYYPVAMGEKIYYTGQFTKQNRIFSCDISSNTFDNYETYTADYDEKYFSEIPNDVITLQNPADVVLNDALKYDPLRYYSHPVIIPISSITSYCFDVRNDYYGEAVSLPYGITTISANPWGKGQLQLSIGFDSTSSTYGIMGNFTDGTDTSLFAYSINGQLQGDFAGFKQLVTAGNISFNLDWISISDTAEFLVGRSHLPTNLVVVDDDITNDIITIDSYNFKDYLNRAKQSDRLLFVDNQFGVTFGKVQTYESELLNRIGGLFNVSFFNLFEKSLTGTPFSYSTMNLGATINIYIPKLLPLKCYDRFVYNLPTVLFASTFTNATDVFSGAAKTTIFGYDIQKGIPFFFFTKIYFDAGYQFAFKYKDYGLAGNFEIMNIQQHLYSLSKGLLPYTDVIFIDAKMEISPNIGMIGIPITFTLGVGYSPNPLPNRNRISVRINFESAW